MAFVAIDFEASCLPRHGRSFPIEVAISGPEGTHGWLIRPDAAWHDWHWAEEAQHLHGIDRARLAREGLPAAIVLGRLNAMIAGRRVYADSPLDAGWLATLAAAAGSPPGFAIDHASRLIDEIDASAADVSAAMTYADVRCPGRHRAGADARWLWCLLNRLNTAPAAERIAA